MNEFVTFLIAGIVTGSVYALAASGLVVTYTTTGVFNFAHGAVGMISAFLYWQLRVGFNLPAPIALIAVIVVCAPLFGALVERFLIRPLKDMSLATSLVVTIGLMVGLMGLAEVLWPTSNRELPIFFGTGHRITLAGVNVYWSDITSVVLAIIVAFVLRYLLFKTRIGLAMRAQVDNKELTSLNGAKLSRVSMFAWALGFSLAALSGVLLAPTLQLSVTSLTLLVVDAYAAAMIGRLKNLPMTYLGALLLGLAGSFSSYLPDTSAYSAIRSALPTFFLFGVLLFMPSSRIRIGQLVKAPNIRVPSLRASVIGGLVLVIATSFVMSIFNSTYVGLTDDALATAVIMLSLVLLVGYGGQVSLCQMSFAGIGAYAVVHMNLGGAGGPIAFIAAAILAGSLGLIVALPAIRLQGLYLALSTMAFAVLAQDLFFNSSEAFGDSGSASIQRFHIGSLITFNSNKSYGIFLAVIFACFAILITAVRRGPLGRRLAAMRDSQAACATLGMDLVKTKLAVFGAAAAIAGIGGALLGGVLESVSSTEGVNTGYDVFQSLALLVLVVIGGVSTTSGALIGGFSMWVAVNFAQSHVRGLLLPIGFASCVYVVLKALQSPQPVALAPKFPLPRILRSRWSQLTGQARAAIVAIISGGLLILVFMILDHEASQLESGLLYLSSGSVAITLAQYPDGISPAISRIIRTTISGLGLGRLLDLVGLGRESLISNQSHTQPTIEIGTKGATGGSEVIETGLLQRRFNDLEISAAGIEIEQEDLLISETPLSFGVPYAQEETMLEAFDPLAGTLAGTDSHASDSELEARLEQIIEKSRIEQSSGSYVK